MSDTSQGEGWWVASDRKWYPPETHADPARRALYAQPEPVPVATPSAPVHTAATPTEAPTESGAASQTQAPGTDTPFFAPVTTEPAVSPPAAEDPPTPGKHASGSISGGSRRPVWLWLVGALTLAVLVVAVVLITSGNDDAVTIAAPGDAPSSTATDAPDEPEDAPTTAAPEDTDDDAGADSTEADQDTDTDQTTVSDVGTLAKPAGLGQIYVWEEWRGAVVGVVDAETQELLAQFAEPPAAGNIFLVVMYDITYTGSDLTGFAPFIVGLSGSREFDAFGCSLDPVALAEQGRDAFVFELVAGQTARLAECFEVPAEDGDDVLISLDNVQQFGPEIIFAPGGKDLPDPGQVSASPDFSDIDLLPYGSMVEWERWSGKITGMIDAQLAGLVSPLSEPAQDGYTYMAVTFNVTYTGTDASDFYPLQVAALGSAVFESFGKCSLDPDLLADTGIETIFELVPGQTASLAQCLEIPDDELDTVVLRLSNPIEFRTDPFYYSAN